MTEYVLLCRTPMCAVIPNTSVFFQAPSSRAHSPFLCAVIPSVAEGPAFRAAPPTPPSSRAKRSAAEGPASPRPHPYCRHPERSEAQPRDLHLRAPTHTAVIPSGAKRSRGTCISAPPTHTAVIPSVAKRSRGTCISLPPPTHTAVIPSEAKRSRGTCISAPRHPHNRRPTGIGRPVAIDARPLIA
jgi:hypothetical protein